MKRKTKRLLLNWKILLLILFLVGSIATLALRPLTYGIDISGGVALVAQTEHPVDSKTMSVVVDSLQRRLNNLGLRDITVEAQGGNQIVLVKVANISTEEQANQIKTVIESQGVFYMEFSGVIFGTGKDVEYVGVYKINSDNSWSVPFRISKSAAEKFAKLAKGKPGWPVDMFLDPPVNSLLVVPESVYKAMNSSEFNARAPPEAPTLLERITKAFNISVVAYANQSAGEIAKLAEGKDKVVLVDVPQELQTELEGMNVTVRYVARAQGESDHQLIVQVLGLYGPYSLGEGLTVGEAQQDVQITGSAPPDRLSAEQEASKVYTVLKSGSLPPVKLNVVGMQFISPRLGEGFKTQALYAGIGALIAVFLIVYFHYRNLKIAVPVASTSLFEAIIILGFAALIQWNLDLPSIAGIIAAIGTGVDQQVVITDELLGGGREAPG